MPILALVLAASIQAAPASAPSDDLAGVAADAIRLYDQGDYEQARVLLEGLDAAAAADGPLLYRLFFCERVSGREDAAMKALDRARQALERQLPLADSLEIPFYLANTYANSGRAGEAQDVARSATGHIEAGTWKIPDSAIGLFQLGKLYQDQGRSAEAVRYYTKAIEGFDLKDGRYAGNARWALRYLGNVAYAKGDFAASDAAFVRLAGLGGALPSDWNALAAARVRLGNYAGAAEAWATSVKLDPANADDPRYSARLADTAAALAPLAKTDAGGAAFAAMGPSDLEAVLKGQAEAARAAQRAAVEALAPGPDGVATKRLDPKIRLELGRKLRDARSIFVAAALEYAVRKLPIRETAFREGYAVLVFQDREWELPPDPEPAPAQ